MKLDQLQYFVEAARFQHVGKAARSLHISPSAISHAIAALEEELSCELFERQGKNVVLTPKGEEFKGRAEKILADVMLLQKDFTGTSWKMSGAIRLAASHGMASRFVAEACAKVAKEHSEIFMELVTLRSAEVVRHVLEGQVDFGVCFSPQEHPDLEQELLYEGKIKIYVQKNHPLAKKNVAKVAAELSQTPAVLPKAFQGIDVCENHPVLQQYGIHGNQLLMAFDSYEVAVSMVGRTGSWGFFPDIVEAWSDDLVALPIPRDWEAPYRISGVWRKKGYRHPGIEMLISAIQGISLS